MSDLTVVIVSFNDRDYLERCLPKVFEASENLDVDIVIVDNARSRETRVFVESRYPTVRYLANPNLGFAQGNNVGIATSEARYFLLLNPDTEIVEGTLDDLVATMDARPRLALCGVRHVTADGALYPTIRRFPTIPRALGQALGIERWQIQPTFLSERELDQSIYSREVACDWTTGAFMLVRAQALSEVGGLDDQFFLYSEETDLCRRLKDRHWEIRHLPTMTIIHHAGRSGLSPRLEAQNAFARVQYARKHLRGRVFVYRALLALGYVLRLVRSPPGEAGKESRAASWWALRIALGLAPEPFDLSG